MRAFRSCWPCATVKHYVGYRTDSMIDACQTEKFAHERNGIMKSKKQILEKIHPVNPVGDADAAKTGVARARVSKRPRPGGSSISTTWDRHRPDHFRAAGK